MEEQPVHVPEPVLQRRRLRRGRRGEGVRVDLREREMAKREADAARQSSLDTLDLSKRLTRVRALVVAVLDYETTARWAADVIDLVVDRVEARLRTLPAHVT